MDYNNKNTYNNSKIVLTQESFLDRYYTMPISQQEFDFLQQQHKNTTPDSNQINEKKLVDKKVDTKQQGSN